MYSRKPFMNYGGEMAQRHAQMAQAQAAQAEAEQKRREAENEKAMKGLAPLGAAFKDWRQQREYSNAAPPMHPEDDLYVPPGVTPGVGMPPPPGAAAGAVPPVAPPVAPPVVQGGAGVVGGNVPMAGPIAPAPVAEPPKGFLQGIFSQLFS